MPEDKEAGAGLFGWRDWKWSDSWHQVSRDRTEISPTAGSYDWNETDQGNPGHPGFLNGGRGTIDMTDPYNPVRNPQRSIAWDLMQRTWTPFMKNWFTDVGAHVASNQGGICQDFELRAMECIEYFGAKQGITACKDWYDDYMECRSGAKQRLRIRAMFKKRHIDNHLEYLQGKRTWEETYEPPPKYNSFSEPWFDEKYSHMGGPMQT